MGGIRRVPETRLMGGGELSADHAWRVLRSYGGWPLLRDAFARFRYGDGRVGALVADPRLIWPDAMWIDRDGFLWIPAAQLNRTPGAAGGQQRVNYPVWIYKLPIGAGPPARDHS